MEKTHFSCIHSESVRVELLVPPAVLVAVLAPTAVLVAAPLRRHRALAVSASEQLRQLLARLVLLGQQGRKLAQRADHAAKHRVILQTEKPDVPGDGDELVYPPAEDCLLRFCQVDSLHILKRLSRRGGRRRTLLGRRSQ